MILSGIIWYEWTDTDGVVHVDQVDMPELVEPRPEPKLNRHDWAILNEALDQLDGFLKPPRLPN